MHDTAISRHKYRLPDRFLRRSTFRFFQSWMNVLLGPKTKAARQTPQRSGVQSQFCFGVRCSVVTMAASLKPFQTTMRWKATTDIASIMSLGKSQVYRIYSSFLRPSGGPYWIEAMRQLPFSTNAASSSSSSSSNGPSLNSEQLLEQDLSKLSDEELKNTSDIPGWNLVHCPPISMPRGALVGKVVSTKMQKTINVSVNRYKWFRKINYRVRFNRKFMAHDENEVANTGDTVMIRPCHKMSKNKHFILAEIIKMKNQI